MKPKPTDTSRREPYGTLRVFGDRHCEMPDPPPRELYSRNDLLWGYIILGFGIGFVVGILIAALVR